MLSSTKSKNLTLNAGAHFYLAYLGTAWVALNYPPKSDLEWSIVTLIDLRMRPDGFLNTPPVATVVSPQYAFVNRTIQIQIPVSDANVGDDVRCRWSTYTSGTRRKRSNVKQPLVPKSIAPFLESPQKATEFLHIRKKEIVMIVMIDVRKIVNVTVMDVKALIVGMITRNARVILVVKKQQRSLAQLLRKRSRRQLQLLLQQSKQQLLKQREH